MAVAVEFRHDFHNVKTVFWPIFDRVARVKPSKVRAKCGDSANCKAATCTILGHNPVDGMHSIDLKGDKIARFSLTLKLEGVKTTSFFDTF